MTNHEYLSQTTGEKEPIEIEALGMLLSRIWTDVKGGAFNHNFNCYPSIYKAMVEWLKSEVRL